MTQGRGTFLRDGSSPNVLVVEDDPVTRVLVRELVKQIGERPVEACGPDQALRILEREHAIAVVLTDVRMPMRDYGIGFIREVRQRWPEIGLAAITSYPDDLSDLLETPECPDLILSKPVNRERIEQAVRLGLGRPSVFLAQRGVR
jgi:CheY-like chemotaxis protein